MKVSFPYKIIFPVFAIFGIAIIYSQFGSDSPKVLELPEESITSVVSTSTSSSSVQPTRLSDISCFRRRYESMPSILEANPPRGKSIFFLETSCRSEKSGKIVINARQACAVESAARANPNLKIFVLFVSPGVVKYDGSEADRIVQAVLSYNNVGIYHLDMGRYFEGTPVQNLWDDGKLEATDPKYVYSHTSDVLRFLTLWKCGGIYMDLDVIVMKSLQDIPLNFACIESPTLVGSTILAFEPNGTGHNLVEMCLNDLRTKFNGKIWTNNGPGVITRFAQKICKSSNVKGVINRTCEGFKFYPSKYFLPVPWNKWKMLFEKKSIEKVNEMINGSYSVHVWSNLNQEEKLTVDMEVPYTNLAKEYCPKVFQECDHEF